MYENLNNWSKTRLFRPVDPLGAAKNGDLWKKWGILRTFLVAFGRFWSVLVDFGQFLSEMSAGQGPEFDNQVNFGHFGRRGPGKPWYEP